MFASLHSKAIEVTSPFVGQILSGLNFAKFWGHFPKQSDWWLGVVMLECEWSAFTDYSVELIHL